MGRRVTGMLRGLLSTLFTLALLIGPPLALVRFVGWPFPEGLPTFDEITAASRSGIDDAVIIKTLAILGWMVWTQIALALLVEFGAVIRGLPAPSLPVIPGMQLGAGRLLASSALLFTSVTATRQPVPLQSIAPATTAPIAHVIDQDPIPSAPAIPNALDTRTEVAAPQRMHVVEANDSWWELAERSLGDGLRWREVRSMNVGRAMPDGETISASTERLEVGWVLAVPSAEPNESVPEWIPPASVVVERGDNLWELAEEHLEVEADRELSDAAITPYWVDVVAENTQFADPNLVMPGDVVSLPSRGTEPGPTEGEVSAPVPHVEVPSDVPPVQPSVSTVPPPTTTTTVSPTTEATPVDADTETAVDEGEAEESVPSTAGLLGIAGSMLAVGLSVEVLRRRRRREQQLPPGRLPPSPPDELDDLRAEIVREADYDLAATLASGLSTIAGELGSRRHGARVRLIQATPHRFEAVLSERVVPAPTGWTPEASGSAWAWEPDEVPSAEAVSTHPAVVAIGEPDGDAQLFLDLEAEGLVNLTGDAAGTSAFLRSLLYELAVSPLSEGASIVVVGDVGEAPDAELDRLHRVPAWSDIADSALAWAHQTRDVLAANRWPTPPVGRALGDRVDDLAPMIIVIGEEPDDERFTALCTVIGEAIVPSVIIGVGTAIEGATEIIVTGDQLAVPALNLICRARGMAEESQSGVDALLDVSAQLPEEDDTPLLVPVQLSLEGEPPDGPYTDPPFDILVRVLGDIEVIGGHRPLLPKQVAVVVFVALHTPVSSSRVEDAIWSAPSDNRKRRLANTVSLARGALGAEHFPAANDGKYRAGPRVLTDLEIFERRLKLAVAQDQEEAIETLRGAIDLVSGPVFTYRNTDRAAYGWVDSENWISDTELKVTGAAADLAQRYLDVGDAEGAAWAARRGLAASPTHAELTKLLMEAHCLAGDAHTAAQVYESYVSALEYLGIDEVEEELVEAYEQIGRQTV